MRRQTKITTDSLGCRRETARRRVPVEILFTADELYKEYVPKIIVNNKINLFFKTAIGILVKKFQTTTVSERCSIKLLLYILFEKIFIF